MYLLLAARVRSSLNPYCRPPCRAPNGFPVSTRCLTPTRSGGAVPSGWKLIRKTSASDEADAKIIQQAAANIRRLTDIKKFVRTQQRLTKHRPSVVGIIPVGGIADNPRSVDIQPRKSPKERKREWFFGGSHGAAVNFHYQP
tara:strand:- start:1729 stop:2154 length:426 start_codon:yes stop_codon:yes gene_type:complete